ncbi:hypothetical protein [Streptomyces sp. NBC_01142]|nr:hypothetical protein [Streptomyces sp. NBC_01142]
MKQRPDTTAFQRGALEGCIPTGCDHPPPYPTSASTKDRHPK